MTVRVLALSSGTTGLEDHRHAIAALITPAGPLQTRGGVFAAVGGAADLIPVAAMQAKIMPHYSWIDGGAALEAGYDFTTDADEVLTFDPGEPGVTRVDRVIDRVRNNPYDGSGQVVGTVEVLKGQASGVATPLPPNSELLWEVPVPAGASAGTGGIDFNAVKVDRRRYTATIGGMIPIKDQAERDAILNPYAGLPIWRRDRAWKEVHVGGGAWRVQGIANVASAADRAAITHPYDGQVIARTDMTWLEQYKAGAWRVMGVAYVAAFADLATFITHPYQGQVAVVTANSGGEYRYDGTAWRRAIGESEIRRVATLAVGTGLESLINWDDEGPSGARDPLGVWIPAQPSRFTIPAGMDGRYEFRAVIQWEFLPGGAGSRAAWFTKNGVTSGQYRLGASAGKASENTETTNAPYWRGNLVAGDYLELRVYHTAGGNTNFENSADTQEPARVYVTRIGPAL